MTYRSRDLAYLVVAVVCGIGIYFMFRTMYMAEEPLPFAQEMTLVFLGGVVTIALTAALLNRQTELELRKEGRVIILQQQCAIYMACIEKVAKIVENIRHDAVLIDDLRVLNHQLAVVASEEVVVRFEAVLDALLSGFADGALSGADGEKVMQSVADLTTAMRSDVLQNTALTSTNAASAIRQNSRRMEQLDDLSFEAEVATNKENSNARS
ncbi:hypothetical protein CA223_23205 [Sphingomonas koreensis]|jgi:hypothetical protein|uniref:Uncharacterized protein n=3 Tax=Sphingomonadaceae TaxID=41297 RepID=A0A1L6JHC6_9SPHN|nr:MULTISPECIES: hypothetical protein [Sphingomonadaceae]APR55314.1 hypothetical protein BRX40_22190 [Sphingomonas koreensis]NNG56975.1 hypothetical protein [Sphingomonas paucimobilis]RSU16973.1 hypothetical protein CA224_23695 [Sphingomonas koreensis]RSU18401.1 hypothetical protein CA222_23795 [Sphingomonas koreensis]RSU18604.1 hypothetical protein CA225_24280 [Sphingomonas koreensis]